MERGISLIEVMASLAVIGLVTAGGIIAYNTATDRAEANNLASGLQGFMVDMAEYLAQHHQDSYPGFTEAQMQGAADTAGNVKAWEDNWGSTAASAAQRSDSVVNLGAGTPPPVTNTNMIRLANLPTLRHFDGPDQDVDDEWSIVLSESRALDTSFVLVPGIVARGVGVAVGGLRQVSSSTFCPTPADNSLPDTAAIFEIILDDIDVCNGVANRLSRYESVNNAWCKDDDTNPPWRHAGGNPPDGDAGLYICFNVLR